MTFTNPIDFTCVHCGAKASENPVSHCSHCRYPICSACVEKYGKDLNKLAKVAYAYKTIHFNIMKKFPELVGI